MKPIACSVLAVAVLSTSAAHAQLVKIDGSSTVFPITEAVAEDFQRAAKGKIRVTVGISGTGGGFKKFCRGETDISNASRPILKSEMEACKAAGVNYYELPVAYDALTVVMNPKNTFLKSITVAELKKIWEPASQGKITKWKQVNPAWPDQPIKLFGAGADSGTFDYFTEAIVGKVKSSRGDYTASEDDNVLVQGVSRDINALGYFGFAYYAENLDRLKGVPVVPAAGKSAVEPSEANVVNGSYQPLSRPIFIYVSAAAYDRPEVKQFIDFYMKQGAPLISEVKYVPLPKKAYDYNLDHLAKKQLGTKFGGGSKVGLTIEDLMKLEAKL
ncbi:MAG: PstS family phosphate ABC transporter substrate-binding protein [Betaproteobacteria bacterium]|nr:PstS family phosphate ABC transporter substrate-binding protein [Betaproteobacteria bacterium]